MAVEASLKSKILYKIQLYMLKVIPMVMAFIFWLNTILSYFNIDIEALSYIAGSSVITLIYLYVASYVFRFCNYHRMFLHYVVTIWIIEIYDLYIGIPLDDLNLLLIYQIITGITLFLILYLYVKSRKEFTTENSRKHRCWK